MPDVELTRLARPLGLVPPVTCAGPVWAFCEGAGSEAGVPYDAERVARYVLAGLVRALRRLPGQPPALLPYRMRLGRLELRLVARLAAGGIHLADGAAVRVPPRQVG